MAIRIGIVSGGRKPDWRGGAVRSSLAACRGRPVGLILTAGQASVAPVAAALLDDLAGCRADREPRLRYQCDPRPRRRAGAWSNIAPRAIRKGSFGLCGWVYCQRNLVERFFNRVKRFRGIASVTTGGPKTSSPR